MKALRHLGLAAFVTLVACGSLGDSDGASTELPTAAMGPFRALQNKELKGTAPFVLDDSRAQYTDAAALADGEGVILYAVSGGKIVRTRSLDGRTFFGIGQAGRTPLTVLSADQPWEGAALSGPFAYRPNPVRPDDVWLFYAGAGGIGLARSTDGGRTFLKLSGPILTGAVRAPTVFALPTGELRMLYATPEGIAEARSFDVAFWVGIPGVALGPSGVSASRPDAFDALAVGDPVATTRITPAGRFHMRVLYTGTSANGATSIGFAARYGEDGALTRNPQPTYPTGAQPAYAAPFLYVTQTRLTYPAVAAALEPLEASLGAPADYPTSP